MNSFPVGIILSVGVIAICMYFSGIACVDHVVTNTPTELYALSTPGTTIANNVDVVTAATEP